MKNLPAGTGRQMQQNRPNNASCSALQLPVPAEMPAAFGYSDSSADTQRVQPFAGQYVAAIFFIMVLVLFLQGDSRTYFYDHLDRSRTADLHYRQTGMAHRCQRTDLRTCLLSFFQWYPAEICSSDCHLTACHLFVWRNHLAYVPLLLSRQHVMGRTSQRRNHGNTLCIRFLESRASTTRTFCGRNG